jgi:putative transcriptional regulator
VGQSTGLERLQFAGAARRFSFTMKSILAELRAQRGWTQAELAGLLKVSRQTINAIETERYEPSLSLAFSIAELFERPIEKIFQPKRK